MKNNLLYFTFILSFIAGSCSPSDETNVAAKGSRNLGIHVTESQSTDFNQSFHIAKNAGMDCIPQVFLWTDLEDASGYDPNNFASIMNAYYSQNDMPVSLCISPIAAIDRNMPEELTSLSFSDPILIDRFKQLLDNVHASVPDVDVRYLLIGNEVDLYLSNHEDEWDDYQASLRK